MIFARHCERSEAIQHKRHGFDRTFIASRTLRCWIATSLALLAMTTLTACGNKGHLQSPSQIEVAEKKKAEREQAKKNQQQPDDESPDDQTPNSQPPEDAPQAAPAESK